VQQSGEMPRPLHPLPGALLAPSGGGLPKWMEPVSKPLRHMGRRLAQLRKSRAGVIIYGLVALFGLLQVAPCLRTPVAAAFTCSRRLTEHDGVGERSSDGAYGSFERLMPASGRIRSSHSSSGACHSETLRGSSGGC
jgi:hypothetical protein